MNVCLYIMLGREGGRERGRISVAVEQNNTNYFFCNQNLSIILKIVHAILDRECMFH